MGLGEGLGNAWQGASLDLSVTHLPDFFEGENSGKPDWHLPNVAPGRLMPLDMLVDLLSPLCVAPTGAQTRY